MYTIHVMASCPVAALEMLRQTPEHLASQVEAELGVALLRYFDHVNVRKVETQPQFHMSRPGCAVEAYVECPSGWSAGLQRQLGQAEQLIRERVCLALLQVFGEVAAASVKVDYRRHRDEWDNAIDEIA